MERLKDKAAAQALVASHIELNETMTNSGDPRVAASARANLEILQLLDYVLNVDPKTGEVEALPFNPATDTVKSPLTGADMKGVLNSVTGKYDFSEPDPKTGRPIYYNVDDKGVATAS